MVYILIKAISNEEHALSLAELSLRYVNIINMDGSGGIIADFNLQEYIPGPGHHSEQQRTMIFYDLKYLYIPTDKFSDIIQPTNTITPPDAPDTCIPPVMYLIYTDLNPP